MPPKELFLSLRSEAKAGRAPMSHCNKMQLEKPINVMEIPKQFLEHMCNRGTRLQLWKQELATIKIPIWFEDALDKSDEQRRYLFLRRQVIWEAHNEPDDDEEEMEKWRLRQAERNRRNLEAEVEQRLAEAEQNRRKLEEEGVRLEELRLAESESSSSEKVQEENKLVAATRSQESDWTPPTTVDWTIIMGLPCIILGDMCSARLRNSGSTEIVYYNNLEPSSTRVGLEMYSQFPSRRGENWQADKEAFEAWFRDYYRQNKPSLHQQNLGSKRKRQTTDTGESSGAKRLAVESIKVENHGQTRSLSPSKSTWHESYVEPSPTWPHSILKQTAAPAEQWNAFYKAKNMCHGCDLPNPCTVKKTQDGVQVIRCGECMTKLGWRRVAETALEDREMDDSDGGWASDEEFDDSIPENLSAAEIYAMMIPEGQRTQLPTEMNPASVPAPGKQQTTLESFFRSMQPSSDTSTSDASILPEPKSSPDTPLQSIESLSLPPSSQRALSTSRVAMLSAPTPVKIRGKARPKQKPQQQLATPPLSNTPSPLVDSPETLPSLRSPTPVLAPTAVFLLPDPYYPLGMEDGTSPAADQEISPAVEDHAEAARLDPQHVAFEHGAVVADSEAEQLKAKIATLEERVRTLEGANRSLADDYMEYVARDLDTLGRLLAVDRRQQQQDHPGTVSTKGAAEQERGAGALAPTKEAEALLLPPRHPLLVWLTGWSGW